MTKLFGTKNLDWLEVNLMTIVNEIDLKMVVEEWINDGFDTKQCIDALCDGALLESLNFDSTLSEDEKQAIVESVCLGLEAL